MKKIILGLILLIAGSAHAQYKPADQGSELKFTIANLGFDIPGKFTGLAGTINFEPANTAAATFDVLIDAATVNTDNTLRDGHLKEATYFDVKTYPRIRLISTKITGKNGNYTFSGRLTIKNKTKEISFPFTAKSAEDALVFTGKFKINRKDFDLGGTSTIANELEVDLQVRAIKA